MRIKTLLILLVATLMWTAPVWAKKKTLPPPLLAEVAPQWVAVPAAPGVMYAPNLNVDLFCHGGKYYYYHGGSWYRGQALQGPWAQVAVIPQPFYRLDAVYFHTPPGWARGKKTGWGGAPMPPGQMKKLYQ